MTVKWVAVCCEMFSSSISCTALCTIPDHSENVSLSQAVYFRLVKVLKVKIKSQNNVLKCMQNFSLWEESAVKQMWWKNTTAR